MEYVFAFAKALLLLVFWILVQAPFIRWSARVVKIAPVSTRAAIMLGIIISAAGIVSTFVSFLMSFWIPPDLRYGQSYLTVLAVTAGLFGYYLRDREGQSIGFWRGAAVFTLSITMMFGVLLVVAAVLTLVSKVTGLA